MEESRDFPPSRKQAAQNDVKSKYEIKEAVNTRQSLRAPGEQNARRILLLIGGVFVIIFIVALFVAALSGGGNNLLTAFGVDTDIKAVLSRVINVVFGIGFVVTIVILVVGAFMHLAALGEPNQVRRARRILVRSGISLVIISVLWIIFTLLLGNVSAPVRRTTDTSFKITTEPANLTVAAPISIKFEVTNINPTGRFFSWDFGDGTTGSGPALEHEYTKEGRFIVNVTSTDTQGNAVQASTVVVINNIRPNPVVKVAPVSGPPPLKVSFDASGSTDPNGQITSQQWKFGDDSDNVTDLKTEHTYTKEGTYTATLTLTDNNFDVTEYPVTITVGAPLNAPVINISTTPPATEEDDNLVVRGELPLTVRFSAADSTDDGQLTSFDWDYGDGDRPESGKIVNHTFTEKGTYKVKVTVKDNDGNTSEKIVTVIAGLPKQAPQAQITTDPKAPERGALQGAFPFVVNFTAEKSRDVDGNITDYIWDFGDNTDKVSGQRVSHTFTRAGTFTVNLIVKDNDNLESTPATQIVQVRAPDLQKPEIQIITNPATPSGDVPFNISFDASGSTSANGNIISYEWDFGDGAKVISNAKIAHTYNSPGVYTVALTARDIANQTATKTLVVAVRVAAPVAQIDASRTRGPAPLSILFNAAASHGSITEYRWDFNDGTVGQGRSIEHVFAQPGRYNVNLRVTDVAGQVDTAQIEVTVE